MRAQDPRLVEAIGASGRRQDAGQYFAASGRARYVRGRKEAHADVAPPLDHGSTQRLQGNNCQHEERSPPAARTGIATGLGDAPAFYRQGSDQAGAAGLPVRKVQGEEAAAEAVRRDADQGAGSRRGPLLALAPGDGAERQAPRQPQAALPEDRQGAPELRRQRARRLAVRAAREGEERIGIFDVAVNGAHGPV